MKQIYRFKNIHTGAVFYTASKFDALKRFYQAQSKARNANGSQSSRFAHAVLNTEFSDWEIKNV